MNRGDYNISFAFLKKKRGDNKMSIALLVPILLNLLLDKQQLLVTVNYTRSTGLDKQKFSA